MITMIIFAGLMFAFNTMLLSRDTVMIFEDIPMMAIMIGIATFFIVLIIAWLIRYMVSFMLEKRGREFGTYLLIGMKKKQISRLFFRENLIMGSLAFLLGLVFGIFLQQVLMTIFYSMMGVPYTFNLDLNSYSFLMTAGFYFGCYLLALWRSQRKFRKMNINNLMNVDKHNQKINEKGDKGRQWLFFIALIYMAVFYFLIFRGGFNNALEVVFLYVGFAVAIYLIYLGLSSFIVRYIRKKRDGIYKSGNLFLLRQFSGKIKTMPFTMGTLTVLFAFAMIGLSCAMMLSDYLNNQLYQDYPFDIILSTNDLEYDFSEEIVIVAEKLDIEDAYGYIVYQNATNDMNAFLFTNMSLFKDDYKLPDGSSNQEKIAAEGRHYYDFDTYMKLSDYNHLRKMIGYGAVELGAQQYLIQLSERVYLEVGEAISKVPISIAGVEYEFAGFSMVGFSQDGHNGADYIIVVPDAAIDKFTPFYRLIAIDVSEEKVTGLQEQLYERLDQYNMSLNNTSESSYISFGEADYDEVYIHKGFGTKQIMIYGGDALVRADVIVELKYLMSSMIFPLFYIAMVYLCVALTVLSVQQLSDSNKYKFRYAVLSKLGLGNKGIDKIIWRQLLWYYLCPIITAIVVSAVIILLVSDIFIRSTGISTMVGYYFGISIVMLLGIYMLYFLATYVLFKRNVAAG
jgi:hypothetical protein